MCNRSRQEGAGEFDQLRISFALLLGRAGVESFGGACLLSHYGWGGSNGRDAEKEGRVKNDT